MLEGTGRLGSPRDMFQQIPNQHADELGNWGSTSNAPFFMQSNVTQDNLLPVGIVGNLAPNPNTQGMVQQPIMLPQQIAQSFSPPGEVSNFAFTQPFPQPGTVGNLAGEVSNFAFTQPFLQPGAVGNLAANTYPPQHFPQPGAVGNLAANTYPPIMMPPFFMPPFAQGGQFGGFAGHPSTGFIAQYPAQQRNACLSSTLQPGETNF